RPLWLGVLAVMVLGFVALLGRFESPRRDERPPPPAWLAVLAGVLTCGGLAVMAKFGIVDADGGNWVWPLLPIAAQLLLRTRPRRLAPVAPSQDSNFPGATDHVSPP
ncbi:MAG: hypothetical protein ABR500_02485, partial [Dermatophilaceae bacterium]